MPKNAMYSTDLTWSTSEEFNTTIRYHKEINGPSADIAKSYCHYHGVAQGSPLSPTLSTLVLIPSLLLHFPNVLQYADDGLIYGDNINISKLSNIEAESGIQAHLNEPKSQYIKKSGE